MGERVAALTILAAIVFAIFAMRFILPRRREQKRQPPSFDKHSSQDESVPNHSFSEALPGKIEALTNQLEERDFILSSRPNTNICMRELNHPVYNGVPESVTDENHLMRVKHERMRKILADMRIERTFSVDNDEDFAEIISFAKEWGDDLAVAILREMQSSGCRSLEDLIDYASGGKLERFLSQSVATFLSSRLEAWGLYDTARRIRSVAARPPGKTVEAITAPLPRASLYPSIPTQSFGRLGCGKTSDCSNYQKIMCPLAGGANQHIGYCASFLTKSISYGYGGFVEGHWRRSKSGKMTWVKPHNRRR